MQDDFITIPREEYVQLKKVEYESKLRNKLNPQDEVGVKNEELEDTRKLLNE